MKVRTRNSPSPSPSLRADTGSSPQRTNPFGASSSQHETLFPPTIPNPVSAATGPTVQITSTFPSGLSSSTGLFNFGNNSNTSPWFTNPTPGDPTSSGFGLSGSSLPFGSTGVSVAASFLNPQLPIPSMTMTTTDNTMFADTSPSTFGTGLVTSGPSFPQNQFSAFSGVRPDNNPPPTFGFSPSRPVQGFGDSQSSTVTGFGGAQSSNVHLFGGTRPANVPFGGTPQGNTSAFGNVQSGGTAFGIALPSKAPAFDGVQPSNTPAFGVVQSSSPPASGSSQPSNAPVFGAARLGVSTPASPTTTTTGGGGGYAASFFPLSSGPTVSSPVASAPLFGSANVAPVVSSPTQSAPEVSTAITSGFQSPDNQPIGGVSTPVSSQPEITPDQSSPPITSLPYADQFTPAPVVRAMPQSAPALASPVPAPVSAPLPFTIRGFSDIQGILSKTIPLAPLYEEDYYFYADRLMERDINILKRSRNLEAIANQYYESKAKKRHWNERLNFFQSQHEQIIQHANMIIRAAKKCRRNDNYFGGEVTMACEKLYKAVLEADKDFTMMEDQLDTVVAVKRRTEMPLGAKRIPIKTECERIMSEMDFIMTSMKEVKEDIRRA
eukprot:g4405.t1